MAMKTSTIHPNFLTILHIPLLPAILLSIFIIPFGIPLRCQLKKV
jgi:nucleoside recognition membrane protein YjiH